MDLNLTGKRVFISGSTRGIGFGIASQFVNAGADVILNSRSSKQIAEVVETLNACGGVTGDVTSPSVATSVIEEAALICGGLDTVICNVGSGSSVAPGAETYEEWERVFALNFFSAINVISASLKFLKESHGSIVCISSICGCETIVGAPVTYSVAKSALNTYVNAIARPFGNDGIRINSIAPGNINFEGSVWSEKLRDNPGSVETMLSNEVPLGRLGSPSDVANLAVWLSSDAAKFVTGSIFRTDGGQTRNS